MSLRVFRWVLVITNLILILVPVAVILLSYFFLVPKVLDDEISRTTSALSAAFAIWSCVLVLTSICFLGITFTNSCCLHLIAALLLAGSAALAAWLVVEQFLFRDQPNWTIVGVSLIAAVIWTIQVLTELLLSCLLCCGAGRRSADGSEDPEAAKKAEAEAEGGDGSAPHHHHNSSNRKSRSADDGSDEEKERLVVNSHTNSTSASSAGPGGAFVPSPQAPPIEEVDEGEEEEDEDEDEEEEEEEEGDSQAGIRMIDRSSANSTNLHLHHQQAHAGMRSIPEEKQHLLHGMSAGPGRPMSRTSQGSGGGGGPCPLATPEDTGV